MNEFDYMKRVLTNIHKVMYGIDDVIKLALVSLYTGGHVLLEGNPGLGKTMLVRSLAENLGFGHNAGGANGDADRWARIQFTPDLMPSDITGTKMPVTGGGFEFQRGPIFTWLLLADEINRATPKTQSAMLEAMAERQVTVLGITYPLAEKTTAFLETKSIQVRPPFVVFATQNPIDQEGTHDLPEAQSDRFMFKVRMDIPDADTLARIMQKDAGLLATPLEVGKIDKSTVPSEAEALYHFQELSNRIRKTIHPMGTVQQHIINMVLASNGRFDGLERRHQSRAVETFFKDYLQFGLGPRAATALMLGAKGWNAIEILCSDADRWPVDGEYDTQAGLAKVVLPVLRHRLKLRLDWENRYADASRSVDGSSNQLHDRLLKEFVINSAPADRGYEKNLRIQLDL